MQPVGDRSECVTYLGAGLSLKFRMLPIRQEVENGFEVTSDVPNIVLVSTDHSVRMVTKELRVLQR